MSWYILPWKPNAFDQFPAEHVTSAGNTKFKLNSDRVDIASATEAVDLDFILDRSNQRFLASRPALTDSEAAIV